MTIKQYKFLILFLCLNLIFLGCFSFHKKSEPLRISLEKTNDVAQHIRAHYDRNLFRLKPKEQGHYAIRLYRMTGDESYLNPVTYYAAYLKSKILRHLPHLEDPNYAIQYADRVLSKERKSDKLKQRSAMLGSYKPYLLPATLLYYAYQMHHLGLYQDSWKPLYDQVTNYLRPIAFEDFLLSEEVIRYHSAEAVNSVYYLKKLGIKDIEEEFIERFKTVMMNPSDEALDAVQYENKIYGLTHFVIGASDYYQQAVEPERFSWVFDYLEAHIDEIIMRNKADVIGEVGLAFKLAGMPSHDVVYKCQLALTEVFQEKHHIIPSQKGNVDLNRSEHRNVVAIMLLYDFKSYFKGPQLPHWPKLWEMVK